PSLISCRTRIGFGAPTKEGSEEVHCMPLGAREVAAARARLGWESEEAFHVPSELRDAWRIAGLRSGLAHKAWEKRRKEVETVERGEFDRRLRGDLPAGFEDTMLRIKARLSNEAPRIATRKASEIVLETVNALVPEMIGGSADLSASNGTRTEGLKPIAPGKYDGRYLFYGVREHAMAAIMNGMALHGGIIPYGGTFLAFSDYCRPAMRLAAQMRQRVVYVMTHDSIGLGEDGSTHQPVEHLAALRAMPGLYVFRPADAVETAECWHLALTTKAPSVLALTRQIVPTVRAVYEENNLAGYGAYEIAPASGDALVSIFSSGSEVAIALEAKNLLDQADCPTRVVSVPCFELFNEQSDDYRAGIVGSAPVRVAVEAAVRMGWDALIGADGLFVGMSGYGRSGQPKALYQHFGITAEKIADAALTRLAAKDDARVG
ncbi:MAG TPA: transketolase C-terminal domain-containing protein, partial [Kaistiaceae bacterium]|nr:transketolase C-terminal domain-containing protein [Kaistiaceae bacterium]